MKKIVFIIAEIFAGLMLVTPAASFAQTAVESTTTTTTSAGTVTEFSPDALVIKSETSSEPLRYSFTKTTSYLDETGAPVSVETVKTGLPVTVYYDRDGDQMVARKVIVRKSVQVAQPNATAGTVSVFGPQEIVVKSETAPEPFHYRYSKTTTYVDETGAPVSIETVRSGLPVTVYYDKEGSELVARKVVVRTVAPAYPDASTVIEHKKTTTTTKDRD